MFSSCVVPAHSFAPMSSARDTQIAWVRAVLAHLGISATELARRAKIAPSTLHRPLNDPEWSTLLSSRTLAAVAGAAGLEPLEFPNRGRGMGEVEAESYSADQGADAADNFDRAVRELCQGRNGRDPWVMKSYALELAGVLPGDVLVVDLNLQPQPGDIVCAQIFDWSGTRAETVFRVYDPPFLVSKSMRSGSEKPMTVDNSTVVIRGVVASILRKRSNHISN